MAEIPPNVQQLVKKITGGLEKTPLGKRWAQVKTAGKVLTAVYYTVEIVRNEDGSVNRDQTYKKLFDLARSITVAYPNEPPTPEWAAISGVQEIDNGDGTFTVMVPAWLADP